jgi:hypothetical protein
MGAYRRFRGGVNSSNGAKAVRRRFGKRRSARSGCARLLSPRAKRVPMRPPPERAAGGTSGLSVLGDAAGSGGREQQLPSRGMEGVSLKWMTCGPCANHSPRSGRRERNTRRRRCFSRRMWPQTYRRRAATCFGHEMFMASKRSPVDARGAICSRTLGGAGCGHLACLGASARATQEAPRTYGPMLCFRASYARHCTDVGAS